jgi:hypothetical protein
MIRFMKTKTEGRHHVALIIIEGCDGTGKSTLAARLAETFEQDGDDIHVIHRGPPERHPIVEYELALSGYRPNSGVTIICDRWHLGADVYGPLKRLDDGLDSAIRWHIEQYLISRGALLVLAESVENHIEMMNARGEDYIDNDEAILVVDGFRRAAMHSLLPRLADSIPFDLEKIREKARSTEQRAAALAAFPSYVGPRRPRTLLLGDKKNRNNPALTDLLTEGAFVPYKQSSGTYLIKALLLAATPLEVMKVGLANANEEDVARLWDTLYNPQIIALGREAAQACENASVPHAFAPHPAYVRRFMHKDIMTYGRTLL